MAGPAGRIDVVLVVGGRWHDFDYARVQLLAELGRHDVVRTRVFEDYASTAAIEAADVLITYTCDVRPSAQQQAVLASFVARGGRWLALHGSNSAINPRGPGQPRYLTPRELGVVADVLGSQFVAHPPITPYLVTPDQPDHPLVAGIPPFTTTDELYVSELHPPLDVLLSTRFQGECPSFTEQLAELDDDPRPVMYLKQTGAGTVLYLTLGHCRGRLDVQDLGIDDFGRQDRGSWVLPEFTELVSRTVAWAAHGDAWPRCLDRTRTAFTDALSLSTVPARGDA